MDKSTPLPWLLNVKNTLNNLTFFFPNHWCEVCWHTCPAGCPSCTSWRVQGSLLILPSGPSPKAPGLVLGLQPQPLLPPTLSKIPTESPHQICLLLCAWSRSRAVSLGPGKSLIAVDILLSVYSTFTSFLVTSCCLYDAAQTPPKVLTPRRPCSCFLSSGHTGLSLHRPCLLRSLSGMLLSPASASANSTHQPRVQLFSSPASGEGTSLSSLPVRHLVLRGWSIYHILLKLLMFMSYRPDYGCLWGRNRVSNLSLLKAPSG